MPPERLFMQSLFALHNANAILPNDPQTTELLTHVVETLPIQVLHQLAFNNGTLTPIAQVVLATRQNQAATRIQAAFRGARLRSGGQGLNNARTLRQLRVLWDTQNDTYAPFYSTFEEFARDWYLNP